MNIRIGANVAGAVSGLNQVAAASGKTTAALSKLPNVSNQSTQALMNLSRVAQDAPYGMIGIANNINPLLESFQRLRASSGSTGAALKGLASSMIGAGGLGLAVGIVTSLMVVFSGQSKKAKEDTEKIKTAAEAAAEKQKDFAAAISAASKAVVSQSANLKDLKEILSTVAGEVDNLTTATINQGIAQFLFDKKNVLVQELLNAEIEKGLKLRKEQRPFAGVPAFSPEIISKDPLTKRIAEAKDGLRQVNDLSFGLEKIIKDLFSKSFISVKPDKIEVEKPRDLRFASNIDFQQLLDLQFAKKYKIRPKAFDITGGGEAGTQVGDGKEFDIAVQQANALGDIITGFVTPAFDKLFSTIAKGGNVFKAFGQAIIQSLTQLITKLITTVALAAVLSAVTGGVGGVGFKGAAGFKNIFGSLMGFRAGGGPVSAGMPYMVGENGPERFVPSTSGKIESAGSGRVSQGNFAGMMGNVEFIIRGNTLVGVLAGATRSQNRLG